MHTCIRRAASTTAATIALLGAGFAGTAQAAAPTIKASTPTSITQGTKTKPPTTETTMVTKSTKVADHATNTTAQLTGICTIYADGRAMWSFVSTERVCAWNAADLQQRAPGHVITYTWFPLA